MYKLMLQVVQKLDTPVIPLPRLKAGGKIEAVLSYYQVLHYVSHTNHKNLWKEAFKKYSSMCRFSLKLFLQECLHSFKWY